MSSRLWLAKMSPRPRKASSFVAMNSVGAEQTGEVEALMAIEAAVALQVHERASHDGQRAALGIKRKPLEVSLRQPVHAGDHHRPLPAEERTQHAVEAHEVLPDARHQEQPVVEVRCRPALVA